MMDRRGEWVSTTAAAKRLGVSTRTMRRYTERDLLPDNRSAGGRRIFRVSDLDQLVARNSVQKAVLYGRVSSRRQEREGDLQRQLDRLASAVPPALTFSIHSDVASGLSDRRVGLRRALRDCMDPEVSRLVITDLDRLARFGAGTIRDLLKGFDVELVVLNEPADPISAEAELVNDMLAIVTSFSGRLYGHRSARAKAIRRAVTFHVDAPGGHADE